MVTGAVTRREITARTVLLSLALATLLAAANAYLGLKVGMTVSASIPAAVIAMALRATTVQERLSAQQN